MKKTIIVLGCALAALAGSAQELKGQSFNKLNAQVALKLEFRYHQSHFSNDSKDELDQLAALLKKHGFTVEVQGHSDARGSSKSNMRLTQDRAKAVVDYLIEKGVPANQLRSRGMGESTLLYADAATEAADTKEKKEALHQKNRRTVIKLIGIH